MRHIPKLLLCSILSACSQSSLNLISKYEIIHEEDHLGEYARALSDTEILTFNRSSTNDSPLGLVKVSLQDKTIQQLDSTAIEGRDLFISGEFVAYRLGSKIRILNLSSKISFDLPLIPNSVTKLRTFLATKTNILVGIDLALGESQLLNWARETESLSSIRLSGSPKLHLIMPDDTEVILVREPKRTALYRREVDRLQEISVLQEGLTAQYAAAEVFEDHWGIAYFDDLIGCLKWATLGFDGKILSTEVIDGEPNKTYRGLDIDVFHSGSETFVSYLDGWALKARVAKRSADGKWSTLELPVRGAVGFYSQILSYANGDLKLSFHNFRTDHRENRRQSFEDLAVLTLKINGLGD